MSNPVVLKPVNALNDYIAVMRVVDVPDGVEIDQASLEKISNEGIVVGVGPDAVGADGTPIVELGDRVIIYTKRYMGLCPASGGYEGQNIAMARKLDLVAKLSKTDKYEFEK